MAVKMRLMRMGDKKNPQYRVVVVDSRKAATGEYIECVGNYHPTANPVFISFDADKAKDWLSKGVQPTDTVKNLLVKAGVVEKPTKLSPSKTKGKKNDKE
ncbi:MAG: 30S ribosomal protein S16 [Clostridia bacterium]|nr:30S ribosomal protein S16 [Clostridia bacterium]MBR7099985.1 30S ribosomal protein S16 [Clostridia bacterium]